MNGPMRKEYPTPKIENGTFDEGTSHGKLLNLLKPGQRVLEFGCASGYMSRAMAEMGCRVTAIEIDPAAASEARAYCEEVIVADLDVRPLFDLLPSTRFDVAVFGDVLEHLRDPWRVLDDTRSFLGNGGYVAISIPNVAHGAVRLALLNGSFDYANVGLLDNTHLRFFTLKSVKELCIRAGYSIEEIDRTKVPMFVDTDVVPRVDAESVDPALLRQIVADPEHDTLQFIIRARPLADDDRMTELFNQYHDTQMKLEEASKRVEQLRGQVEALSADLDRNQEDEMLLLDYAANVERLNLENARLEDELAAMHARLANAEALGIAPQALDGDLADARARIAELERASAGGRREEDELLLAEFASQVETLSKENGDLEFELHAQRERVVRIESELATANELAGQIAAKDEAIAALARELDALRVRLAEVEEINAAELAAKDAELAGKEAEFASRATEFASKEADLAHEAETASDLRRQIESLNGRIELLELERDGLDLRRDALEIANARLEAEAQGHAAALDAAVQAAESAEKRLASVRELSRGAAADFAATAARLEETERERERLEQLLRNEESERDLRLREQSERDARIRAEERKRSEAEAAETWELIGQLESELARRGDATRLVAEALEQLELERAVARRLADENQRLRDKPNAGKGASPAASSDELARLKDESRLLKTELRLLVTMFVQHAETELNRLRRDGTAIDSAIRATRSSVFWGVKTLANRVASSPKQLLRRGKKDA